MNKNREELINGSMIGLLFKLSIPGIIGMLVIGLYNLCDAIFVGKLVGESALGAVSIAYPFTLINNCIAVLLGMGSASVLSRAIGAKDRKTEERILGNLILSVFALSVISTIVGYVFAGNFLHFAGAKGDILILGTNYLKIVYIGSFFVNFAQSANMLLRGQGKMKEAMIIMGAGALLNIVLDPIFIKVLGMGIEGAAKATVIAQIIQAVVTFIYFKVDKSTVPLKKIAFAFDLMPKIMSVGISAAIMQVMFLVQQTALYKVVSIYGGNEQLVLMGAAMRVMMFTFIPVWGMSQGLQPIVGMNYGAKKYKRVKSAVKTFSVASTILIGVMWSFFMMAPKIALGWFINDEVIIESGYNLFRIMFLIFPVSGVIIMAMTLFQSIGKGGKAAIITILKQVVLFIPVVIIAPKFIGIKGVWAASTITDFIIFLISIIFIIREFKELGVRPQGKNVKNAI